MRYLFLISLGLFLGSCELAPKEIRYGSDACHYCKMTIVDTRYAAQLVNTKGKAYHFDAVECMVRQLETMDSSRIGLYLVTDYESPKKLVDATHAHYLICRALPSPMGEDLTAFHNWRQRQNIYDQHGGDTLTWAQLKQQFR